jgi:nitroreductase
MSSTTATAPATQTTNPKDVAALAETLAARSLDNQGRRLLFTEARTNHWFLEKEVPESKLKEIHELWKWGPTAANSCPLRVVYLTSEAAKAKVVPHMMDTNQEKTGKAPVVAVLAWDSEFFEQLPTLMPPLAGYADYLRSDKAAAEKMGVQSANLSAAYFIIAARAVGLDAGPMGGFDANAVDEALFKPHAGTPRGNWKSVLVVVLGYGDAEKVYPRAHRFAYEEVSQLE